MSTSSTISFAAPVQLASGLGTQILVTTADMNGDGKLDIAVTGNQSLVSVILNTSTPGSITFSPPVNFTALEVCRGIALGDFDGDGKKPTSQFQQVQFLRADILFLQFSETQVLTAK